MKTMKTNRESLFTIKLSIAVLDKLKNLKFGLKLKLDLLGNCKILKILPKLKLEKLKKITK